LGLGIVFFFFGVLEGKLKGWHWI